MNELVIKNFLKVDSIGSKKISVESVNFILIFINFDTFETTTNKILRSAHAKM